MFTLSGKTSSGKAICYLENISSLFPLRKFIFSVIFESNHFLTFFIAFNIINQLMITTGTSLVLLVIESSNVRVCSSFLLISLSSFSFEFSMSNVSKSILPHLYYLQLNRLQNQKNLNFPRIPPLYFSPICLGLQIWVTVGRQTSWRNQRGLVFSRFQFSINSTNFLFNEEINILLHFTRNMANRFLSCKKFVLDFYPTWARF